MGVVYLALHRRLQRTVALKTLRAEFAGDSQVVARFEREARAASAIGHANIVQVFDAGGGPVPYLVMENLQGESLGALLEREGPLHVDRAIALCMQILAGLEAAHAVGIIHRDLKPDNIFISREGGDAEVVKILDFGISKILDTAGPAVLGDFAATRAGMVMGTPLYMSPEQANGRTDLDHRSDLWSLVCVLYECVSGAPPFSGENYNQLLAALLLGRFAPLKERVPGVSTSLSSLVDRGLSAEPDSRFGSAKELREALDSLARDDGASAGDDQMLAAFDNLANKFLAQEEASAPGPTEKPGSSSLSPAAGPVSDARFAPPASTGSVDLALDIDVSSSSRSTNREIATARPAPSRRANSQIVTRKEPGRLGARLASIFLVVLLLAGAGVAYRYYSLGYLLAPEPPRLASLELTLDPAPTRVFLAGVLQSEAPVILPSGEEVELRLRADRRMSHRQKLSAQAGDKLTARVRLGNQLPVVAIDQGAGFAIAPPAKEAVTAEIVDAGLDKLRAYSACVPRLLEALARAQTQVAPLPRAIVDECVLALRVGAERQPPMPLDEASLALASAVLELEKAARELSTSKGASRKLLRARQAAFDKASKAARAASGRWIGQESSTIAQWLSLELALVQRSEPGSMHARLREVAVRSDQLVRTHLSAGDTDAIREQLRVAYSEAEEAARLTSESYEASGGAAFLRAMKPVLEKDAADELLFWHNQAIEVFNQLLLPFAVVTH